MIKKIFHFFQIICLTVLVIITFSYNNSIETKINNNNINKTINLSTMASKISEFDYDRLNTSLDTYTGDLTGYAADCPLCTGYLACLSKYNVRDGTTTYFDKDYGNVRIVASSRNLPCGSIIRFDSKRVSSEPVYAIVLDRGVFGNAIDLLTPSEEYAAKHVGRSLITYDVLRNGWELQ